MTVLPLQLVVALLAIQAVVAGIPEQEVIAGTTPDPVVARTAPHQIVAATPEEVHQQVAVDEGVLGVVVGIEAIVAIGADQVALVPVVDLHLRGLPDDEAVIGVEDRVGIAQGAVVARRHRLGAVHPPR
ncbi:hypothetical protein D3C84_1061620 [compost metagenome]